MAGAMRKMAVYLGLVEDDGYDGRGFDPDDEFEPEHGARAGTASAAPAVQSERPRNGTNRSEPCTPPAQRETEPPSRRGKRTTRANRPRGIHHT